LMRRLAQPSLAAGSQRHFVDRAACEWVWREGNAHFHLYFDQRDWTIDFHRTRGVGLTSERSAQIKRSGDLDVRARRTILTECNYQNLQHIIISATEPKPSWLKRRLLIFAPSCILVIDELSLIVHLPFPRALRLECLYTPSYPAASARGRKSRATANWVLSWESCPSASPEAALRDLWSLATRVLAQLRPSAWRHPNHRPACDGHTTCAKRSCASVSGERSCDEG
jgi:hypothetical protein